MGISETKPVIKDRLILSPGERRDAVLSLIRSARQRLVLSVFRCDDFAVVDEVFTAVHRNVEVRILFTQRARGWKKRLKELGALIESTGAQVYHYADPVKKYHAKYMVADDDAALIGTLNFTRKCFERTCDFTLITRRPDVVSSLSRLFDSDCATPEKPVAELSESLILGPDHARARVTALIENARESIDIIDHRVTDPAIVELLRRKANEGVTVKVFGRGSGGPLISHGKMLVVDKVVAAFGSIALSPPSLDLRREVSIVLTEPEIVVELNAFVAALEGNNSISDMTAQDNEDDEDDEDPA